MRWVKAVSHARTVVFADAAVSASAALAAPTEGKATSLLLRGLTGLQMGRDPGDLRDRRRFTQRYI